MIMRAISLLLNLNLIPCTALATRGRGWGPPLPPTRYPSRSSSSLTARPTKNQQSEESYTVLRTEDVLSLDTIRSTLIRQEETIIFELIERSQFRENLICYEKGGFGKLGTPPGSREVEDDGCLSFLDYMLIGTEALHWNVRRYTSPEEHAFFPLRLPPGHTPILPQLDFPSLLDDSFASDVNFNSVLLHRYIHEIVPSICAEGDDEQHGSSVTKDVNALQALSRRVHYGKFVAESKFRENPEEYKRLVEEGDVDGVMALLTNAKVEEQVLRRARLKAATYGREPLLANMPDVFDSSGTDDATSVVAAAAAAAVVAAVEALKDDEISPKKGAKVDPSVIEGVYRGIIIPLTKVIEVNYLFRRCGKEPPDEYKPESMNVDSLKIQKH